jgi:hypothetical protein
LFDDFGPVDVLGEGCCRTKKSIAIAPNIPTNTNPAINISGIALLDCVSTLFPVRAEAIVSFVDTLLLELLP